MKKLWNFLNRRLSHAEKQKATLPFLHEPIDFSRFPSDEYLQWHTGRNHSLIKQRLQQAFFNHSTGRDQADAAFEFFTTKASNGFALFHRKSYTLDTWDYRFFQHNIAIKLKENKYFLNLADVRSRSIGNGVEQIFRYYLKPSVKLRKSPKAEQLFGNVSIEVILRDDTPYVLKVLANSYQDQNFNPHRPFGELVSMIVS